MTSENEIEQSLRRLGQQWPKDDTFVETVMSQLPAEAPTPVRSSGGRFPFLQASFWTAATILICVGLWFVFGPSSDGSKLYAQILAASAKAQTIHAVHSVLDADGKAVQTGEIWFARGKGFAVDNGEELRIDDGNYFWQYRKGSNAASRARSLGTDDLMDKALDVKADLERDCERFPEGDRTIDGIACRCAQLTFHGDAKPADPAVLNFDQQRSFVFISDDFLLRRVETQHKVDGQWKAKVVRTWQYDVPVDPEKFQPSFGDAVRIVDVDQAFDELVDLAKAVNVERRDGLIFAIHRIERFENGGVFVMSSVRASPETSAKNPPKRRMIQPGLYISDPPAKNWNASPQGNGYFRLTLAAAQHQAVDVQWWIMVPRGVRATWFEVAPGKIELPIGITPTPGTPYAAQHLDNRGVLQHVQWDLTLDVPISAKFPSMSDIATATYNELALLPNGVMRYLDMGVEDVGNVPTAKHAMPDDVSASDFAKAVGEHAHYWQLGDIEFQLRSGATIGANGQEIPAVSLSYQSAVTDDTLKRIAQRPGVRYVWLRGTSITDKGLAHLKALKQLEQLDLAETQITDAGLADLKEITWLQRLDVTGTNVTANGLIGLKGFSPNLEIEGP